ncbi:MAG: hypothetical protein EBW71_09160, partial [Betaproteobacteria bacterium]|nr:hypothetical protein [Betaproteobacteria bacterium]
MNFITDVDQASKKVDAHLIEIMMAQDFHDLTGQVIYPDGGRMALNYTVAVPDAQK